MISTLNLKLLDEKLAQIRISANRLAKMKIMSREAFLADPDHFAVAEHHFRRSLEAVLDIGRHITAKKGLGKPENYRDILELLGRHNVITAEFSKKIQGMAGYRNRLVHGYAYVTPEEIYSLMQEKLDDFAQFCAAVTEYIEAQQL